MALKSVAEQMQATFELGLCAADAAVFSRVSTDTRSIEPGDLFVALRGERFDAHNFLDEAVSKRAGGLVVEHYQSDIAVPQIIVKDTTAALGQIARINREMFLGPVIGVTGSCGKTTVKTLIHNILAHRGNVLATEGSLNNHIGVPLTLFRLAPAHDYAVIEMGASARHEIEYLTQLAKPDVALVTNAMLAHVAGFGSLLGVAESKGEIYQNLQEDGIAVVNWDDPHKDLWLNLIGKRKTLSFGVKSTVDFYATNMIENIDGSFRFEMHTPTDRFPIQMRLLGKHNVANAIAAAACAFAVGASAEDIKVGLEKSQAVKGRMQAHAGINNSIVIDDSYNANPDSVKAAIDSLMHWQGKSILVLGDLAELGEDSQTMHNELGKYAKSTGIKNILATGKFTQGTCEHFGAGAEHFSDHNAIVKRLQSIADGDSVILVKGSRSAHMELVVQAVIADGE